MRFECFFFMKERQKSTKRRETKRDICIFRERLNVRTSSIYRMNMDFATLCVSRECATSFVDTIALWFAVVE